MTPEQIAEIERAAHECDPGARVEWDRSHETLTITCAAECAVDFLPVRYRARHRHGPQLERLLWGGRYEIAPHV